MLNNEVEEQMKQFKRLVKEAPKTVQIGEEFENQLIALMLDDREFFWFCRKMLKPANLDTPRAKEILQFILEYANKYKTCPTREALQLVWVQRNGIDNPLFIPAVDPQTEGFIKDKVLHVVRLQLYEIFLLEAVASSQLLSDFMIEPETDGRTQQLLDSIHEKLSMIRSLKADEKQGLDYFNAGERWEKFMSFWANRIPTGFNSLDTCLAGGGIGRKELICFCGPSGIGKCCHPATEVEIELDLYIPKGDALFGYKIIPEGAQKDGFDNALRIGSTGSSERLDEWKDNQGNRQNREFRFDSNSGLYMWMQESSELVKVSTNTTLSSFQFDCEKLSELGMDDESDDNGTLDSSRKDTNRSNPVGDRKKELLEESQSGSQREKCLDVGLLDKTRIDEGTSTRTSEKSATRKFTEVEREISFDRTTVVEWFTQPIVIGIYRSKEQLHGQRSKEIDTDIRTKRCASSDVWQTSFVRSETENCSIVVGKTAEMVASDKRNIPLFGWVANSVGRLLRTGIHPLVRIAFDSDTKIQRTGNKIFRSNIVKGTSLLSRFSGVELCCGSQRKNDKVRRSEAESSKNRDWTELCDAEQGRAYPTFRFSSAPNGKIDGALQGKASNQVAVQDQQTKITVRCVCTAGYAFGLKNAFPEAEIRILSETGYRKIENSWITQPNPEWFLALESGEELLCADDHKVDTPNDFVPVQNLSVGDLVKTKHGESKVIKVYFTGNVIPMVDFSVEGRHYYSNGILSHNSLWLCNLGVNIVKQGYKVLHITREISQEILSMRYDACFLHRTTDDLTNAYTQDKDHLLQIIEDVKAKNNIADNSLFVKEFPSHSATVDDSRAYVQFLWEKYGFRPDVVIDDYLDLAKASRPMKSRYEEQGQTFGEFRGWMTDENFAGITATQTVRGAENSRGYIGMDQTADSIDKVRIVDAFVTINESYADAISGRQKLYFAKNRNQRSLMIANYSVDKPRMIITDLNDFYHYSKEVGKGDGSSALNNVPQGNGM